MRFSKERVEDEWLRTISAHQVTNYAYLSTGIYTAYFFVRSEALMAVKACVTVCWGAVC
jgi:hypothetical protein